MPIKRSYSSSYTRRRYSKQPTHRKTALTQRIGRCEVCGLEKPIVIVIEASRLKSICEDCLKLVRN